MKNTERYAMQSTGRFTADLKRLMARSYNACQTCGTPLIRDVTAYAGYASDGAPLYVGECCLHLISELATHVYWWWEADKRCAPETVLWRYMDFTKFVALLEQRAVYFARADILGDRFEGAAGTNERRPEWDASYLDFFRRSYLTLPGQSAPLPAEQIEKEARRLLGDLSRIAEHDRRRTFVSCWHANTGESEALWRLYCPPPTAGVAIRTTVGDLAKSMRDDPDVRIGRVQYTDFRNSFAGFHDRIFWKRKSLIHEAEVRAVIKKPELQDALGVPIQVDIEELLLEVVPSPFAPSWFPQIVSAVMRQFGVEVTLGNSELLSEPFF